jgi:hypothetical protein
VSETLGAEGHEQWDHPNGPYDITTVVCGPTTLSPSDIIDKMVEVNAVFQLRTTAQASGTQTIDYNLLSNGLGGEVFATLVHPYPKAAGFTYWNETHLRFWIMGKGATGYLAAGIVGGDDRTNNAGEGGEVGPAGNRDQARIPHNEGTFAWSGITGLVITATVSGLAVAGDWFRRVNCTMERI